MLELLSEVGIRQPVQEARELMDSTYGLRADVLSKLLGRRNGGSGRAVSSRIACANFAGRRAVGDCSALRSLLSFQRLFRVHRFWFPCGPESYHP
ncbi:hypothetical protein GWR55_16520 [Edaphobacter sp. 12200R-103]|nr:hypothetical protein GWR55_16520 [Edaphobacter sp. 12200R-103]